MTKTSINKTKLQPNPVRIEFEVTNHCNAKCEFCPRYNIKKYGMMDFNKYKKFILNFKEIKNDLWINKLKKIKTDYPIIVFGGYGESLLHPKIFKFIKFAKINKYKTELITNGLLLTEENCKKIYNAGLDKLCISLHTLDPKINKRVTSLKNVIPVITKALKYFDDKKINIEIWRVSKSNGEEYDKNESTDAYNFFLSPYKKNIVVLGPTPAWNRGGQLKSKYYPIAKDPGGIIRCQIMFFTLSISFNGDFVLCCCDFSTKNKLLAKEWNFNFSKVQNQIIKLQKKVPAMCLKCRRPKINYLKKLLNNSYL